MPTIDRRRFLQLAGGTIAATMLSDSIARAAAIPANRATQSIQDVEHIVILMQENRSFDHYFGTLRGVRGFGDPHPVTLPSGEPVWNQAAGSKVTLPFRPQVEGDNLALVFIEDLDHSWNGTHEMFNGGKWDSWIGSKGTTAMAHMERQDLPYHYALADAFTVCDGYHCSTLTSTDPNRYYMWTGWDGNNGAGGGPVIGNDERGYSWETYPELLTAAGVSWKIYQDTAGGTLSAANSWGWVGDPYTGNYGDNSLLYFTQFQNSQPGSPLYEAALRGTNVNAGGTFFDQLAADVQAGTLPQVSWIVAPEAYTEHPSWPAGYGAWYTAGMLNALTSDPDTWSKTVLLITFDENDGFFDHVVSPYPNVTGINGASTVALDNEYFDGTAGPGNAGGTPGPYGGGVRVPLLAISPWSKGGYVCSETFDHTSLIRFIEQRFGVASPNVTPWRRAVFGDLTSAFDFTSPSDDVPTLPDVSGYEPNPAQTTPSSYAPTPPTTGAVPVQEPGMRPARPLAYDFGISFNATADALQLAFQNPGTLGIGIQARSLTVAGAPYTYTVGSGDNLAANLPNPGAYDLSLHGPNGWFRKFSDAAPTSLAVAESFDSSTGQVTLTLNLTDADAEPEVVLVADAFSTVSQQVAVSSEPTTFTVGTSGSGGWYDLALSAPANAAWTYALAGRVETEAFGLTSDPQLDGLSHQVAPTGGATGSTGPSGSTDPSGSTGTNDSPGTGGGGGQDGGSASTGTTTNVATPATHVALTPSRLSVLRSGPNPAAGTLATFRVAVAGGSAIPTGAVMISSGSAQVASAQLRSGAATVSVPTDALPVGKHALGVAYVGDSVYAQTSSTVTLSVVKRESRTTLKLSTASVEDGTSAVALVTVAATGGTPTGTVEIHKDGKRIAHGKLGPAGSAKIKLPSTLATGRHKLLAVYVGDAADRDSQSRSTTLQVKSARKR